MAGLLTGSHLEYLPDSLPVAIVFTKMFLIELHSSGTVQDLHLIPF